METGIAEVLFGALVLAVFVFLVTITVTFDSVIGTKKPRRRRADADPKDRPEKDLEPKGASTAATGSRDRPRSKVVV